MVMDLMEVGLHLSLSHPFYFQLFFFSCLLEDPIFGVVLFLLIESVYLAKHSENFRVSVLRATP